MLGSSGAGQAASPDCQITYPEGAGISPCLERSDQAEQSSHCSSSACGTMPGAPQKMPALSMQTHWGHLGCGPLGSCHHAGMSSCQECHFIHATLSIAEGSGRSSPSVAVARNISPPIKNSWTWGLRVGGQSRSSSSVFDQSDWSPTPLSSLQVGRWGSLALASFPGLSLKVTCCLDCTGLGDWTHLLVDSPWHDATWGNWV